jgi:hypothetical protein
VYVIGNVPNQVPVEQDNVCPTVGVPDNKGATVLDGGIAPPPPPPLPSTGLDVVVTDKVTVVILPKS